MRRHRRIKTLEQLTARARQLPTRPHIGRDWAYLVTKSNGRIVLLGPYTDAQEAEEVATNKITTVYEVVLLATRDRSKATQMLRHKMLQGQGGKLEDSLRRMKHQI